MPCAQVKHDADLSRFLWVLDHKYWELPTFLIALQICCCFCMLVLQDFLHRTNEMHLHFWLFVQSTFDYLSINNVKKSLIFNRKRCPIIIF